MANGILMPTTSAQVSGHKFLVRRIEHGLVLGDVRMIHDPLSRRRRALTFGAVACVLIAIGSLALAMFRPAIDPGDAALIQAESGALYVRIDDAVHPVSNLASARLILGEAAEPVAASDVIISATTRGVPVGIANAPSLINPGPINGEAAWLGCHNEDTGAMHVAVLDAQPPHLAEGEAMVGASQSSSGELKWHLITASGRAGLPGPDTPEGRIVRRHLGITDDTPVLHLGPDLLNTIPENPAVTFPEPLPEVVQAGSRIWIRVGEAVQPITALQHGMLIDAGAHTTQEIRPALGGYPDTSSLDLTLPATLVDWVDMQDKFVCADGQGGVMVLDSLDPGVALSGDASAVEFHMELNDGAVGTDSGFGYYLLSDTGLIHPVVDGDTMSALGVSDVYEVPWSVLQLLPQGSELSRESALLPMY